jgi:hypothetical protein
MKMDKFAIPELMDGQNVICGIAYDVICGIAYDVAEQERLQGTTFVDQQLDENIALQVLKTQGEAVSSYLENQ